MLELDSSVVSSKLPIYTFLFGVPVAMPLCQFGVVIFETLNPAFSKALPGQGRQFYLCYVKPASMLRRVMELEPS